MYFLDTNALYWYIGREKLGEKSDAKVNVEALASFLDNRVDKSLASSAFVEAMVKFRNKPVYAERILDFILEKELRVFNNVQYQVFSPEQICFLSSLNGNQLSQCIKEKILPMKIEIEVRFAVGFFMSILLMYTKYCIDESNCICDKHDYDIEMFIRDSTVGRVESELRSALKDAYNNRENLEQQIFKDKYINLLEEGCKYVDVFLGMFVEKDGRLDKDTIEKIIHETNARYEVLKDKNPDNYLMKNISRILSSRQEFMNVAKKRFAEMYSIKGKAFTGKEKFAFRKIQTDYLAEELYYSWMDKAQKFRKNDIFDFFFLGCSDYKDVVLPEENIMIDRSTYLLTFDKKLDRYIERKKPSNGIVIRRFFNDF